MFLRRAKRKVKKGSLFLLLILAFIHPDVAFCAQDTVYKPARIPKQEKDTMETGAMKTPDREGNKGEEAYYYNPSGKTDPFKSFIAIQEEVEEQKKAKPKTYLETLDLSQLELIAIINGPKGNYAMVRDSKGLGHVVMRGTAIGTNGGVVDKITDKEVIIKEEYRDFRGTKKTRDITKKIPSPM
jgi:type IV pilus assembly protein PilP